MFKLPVLKITELEPVPLLHDFRLFANYLNNNQIILTKANEYIPRAHLYQINKLMVSPVKNNTERSEQPSYPLLHLFYHLILGGNLFRKVPAKGGRLALEITERYQMYDTLTLTEKYFFLLETLWVDVNWDKLDTSYHRCVFEYNVPTALSFLSKQKPDKKISMKKSETKDFEMAFIELSSLNLIFSFFGFWQVIQDESIVEQYPKSHFLPEAIIPAYFGVMMAPILAGRRSLRLWNLPLRRLFGEWNAAPGSPLLQEEDFFIPFAHLFEKDKLQSTLPRKKKGSKNKLVDGTFIFKVIYKKNIWRRIEMSAKHDLEDLHLAIQEAYNFGNDHLYCFFMDGKLWSHERFAGPDDDEGPFANEVCIGELELLKGQRILYLFDYGDEWTFDVELEEVSQDLPIPLKPRIIEKKGKSPEQYPFFDD